MEYPATAGHPSFSSLVGINVSRMQTWRIIHDLGIVYKQPKLELQKGDDYEQKKRKTDGYRKISNALLKKDSTWV